MEVTNRVSLGRLLLAALVAISALTFTVARAQPPEDARALFDRGVEATRAARWREARILFERSLQLVVKPSTLINLAITEIKLGNGAEALEKLEAFEREASPVDHGAMLARVAVLRAQAQALVDNEQATSTPAGRSLAPERARSDEGLSNEARAEVTKAREHFSRGDDKEALAAFERAYRISPRPELLYNIGVVADRLRDDARAVQAYEEFATALPDAPEAAVATVRSTALRAAIDERAKQRAVTVPSTPQTPPRDATPLARPSLSAPRAVLATGVVLAGTTVGAIGWYVNRLQNVEQCEKQIALNAMDPMKYKTCANLGAIEHEERQMKRASFALAGLAVGATIVGSVWLVKRKRERSATSSLELTPRLALAPGTGSGIGIAGLELSGHF